MTRPRFLAMSPASLRLALAALLLACTGLLDACGGGDLVAGVGSGGSGVAEGTVSGFGSVIVDGIEYSEQALPAAQRNTLRLGQRVRLVFGTGDVARSIAVLPQLQGPVTAAQDADGWLRLAGQWVRVVQSPDDSRRSGVTLLEGFDGTGTIATGQDVTAFGSWVFDASKASYVLIATRLEKLAAPADPVLLGGVAVAIGPGSLRLGSPAGTLVSAVRQGVLAEGAVIAAQVPRTGIDASQPTVASVVATDVQDASLGAVDLSSFASVRVGGLANAYDSATRTVVIQGTSVRLPLDGAVDASDLAGGGFVRARAGPPAGGALTAQEAAQRHAPPGSLDNDDGTGTVTQLKGVLSGVDWTAATARFTLRGVAVVADAPQISESCRNGRPNQLFFVTVQGYAPDPSAPLRARSVNCSNDLSQASDAS